MNRYKKIPGFTEEDVEQVTNCKVLWKIPNAFHAVSPSIDHGTPIVLQDGPEISRSYRALAAALAEASSNSDGNPDLVFSPEGARKKAPGRLSLSPLRTGNDLTSASTSEKKLQPELELLIPNAAYFFRQLSLFMNVIQFVP